MRVVMYWNCWVEKNEVAHSSQRVIKTVRNTGFRTCRIISPRALKGLPEARADL